MSWLLRSVITIALLIGSVTTARADAWQPGPGSQGAPLLDGAIDFPTSSTQLVNGNPFTVSGWVVDRSAVGWAGVDDVQLFSGRAGEGGVLLGEGVVAQPRPDVGAALNNSYWSASGFSIDVAASRVSPGLNLLTVYAHTPDKGWWQRSISVTVTERSQLASVPAMIYAAGGPADALIWRVAPYPDNYTWYCFSENPACEDHVWWNEWYDLVEPLNSYAIYDAIGPGLVTRKGFRESINLLWQWSEGRALLRDAAASGVVILDKEGSTSSFAYYRPAKNTIVVNSSFVFVSTWMLADVLAHELKHASDQYYGTATGPGSADCLAQEQRAYEVERRYMEWLTGTLVREQVPPEDKLLSRLASEEDRQLAGNLYTILTSANINRLTALDYHDKC